MAFDRDRADAAWLHAWMTGRSLARGLPLPFADRGGLRAEIGTDAERRRWLFAGLTPELHALASEIADPTLKLRALAPREAMRAFLPPSWRVEAPSFAMVGPSHPVGAAELPTGYRLEVQSGGASVHVFVMHASGEMAASGHGGAGSDAFVFDRIVTAVGHRRRGLGRAVMAALGSARPDAGAAQLLVATEAGRALYHALGWRVVAPYASAVWVGDSPVQN